MQFSQKISFSQFIKLLNFKKHFYDDLESTKNPSCLQVKFMAFKKNLF
jgi:hypothetical protein